MERFVMSTEGKLSGLQKAAILLAELGPSVNENYDILYEQLHLTTEQIHKLNITMSNLSPYLKQTPKNEKEIQREISVLNEAIEFGKKRGIFTPIPEDQLKFNKKTEEDDVISDLVKNKPEEVAMLLNTWLGE